MNNVAAGVQVDASITATRSHVRGDRQHVESGVSFSRQDNRAAVVVLHRVVHRQRIRRSYRDRILAGVVRDSVGDRHTAQTAYRPDLQRSNIPNVDVARFRYCCQRRHGRLEVVRVARHAVANPQHGFQQHRIGRHVLIASALAGPSVRDCTRRTQRHHIVQGRDRTDSHVARVRDLNRAVASLRRRHRQRLGTRLVERDVTRVGVQKVDGHRTRRDAGQVDAAVGRVSR